MLRLAVSQWKSVLVVAYARDRSVRATREGAPVLAVARRTRRHTLHSHKRRTRSVPRMNQQRTAVANRLAALRGGAARARSNPSLKLTRSGMAPWPRAAEVHVLYQSGAPKRLSRSQLKV